MRMLLESYWKTAVDRAVDNLIMKIDQVLLQGLDKTTFNKMVDLSLDPEKTALFFELDPREREQRSALEAKLDRLVKAQTIIAKSI